MLSYCVACDDDDDEGDNGGWCNHTGSTTRTFFLCLSVCLSSCLTFLLYCLHLSPCIKSVLYVRWGREWRGCCCNPWRHLCPRCAAGGAVPRSWALLTTDADSLHPQIVNLKKKKTADIWASARLVLWHTHSYMQTMSVFRYDVTNPFFPSPLLKQGMVSVIFLYVLCHS